VALRVRLFGSGGASSDAPTVVSQAVVREALTVIELVMRRTLSAAFRDWCGAHSTDVVGIGIAVTDCQTQCLIHKLSSMQWVAQVAPQPPYLPRQAGPRPT